MCRSIILTMVLILLISIVSAYAQNLLNGPESVAFDTLNNQYLVSNVYDGRIIRIDPQGAQDTLRTGFNYCAGNCIVDDILYFTTGPSIAGIDLETSEIVVDITISGSVQLDGMTADTSGYLYVVQPNPAGTSSIYKINLSDLTYSIFVDSGLVISTQDLIFDKEHNRILACAYYPSAPILAVDLADSTLSSVISSTPGYFDGITRDNRGNTYLASHSAGGTVYMYDSTFTNPPTIISTGHDEPAGLDYNIYDDILAVPNFGGNSVTFINIGVNFESDTGWGFAPLEVNFSGSSPLEVDSWFWNFGDGENAYGQLPLHTYTEPGMYDVSLEINANGEIRSRTKDDYIIILADSLIAPDVTGEPGSTVEAIINVRNSIPLNYLKIPVEYWGTLGLMLDSFSTAECRADHFDNISQTDSNPTYRRATFMFYNDYESPTTDMAPGYGAVLKLYFTISSSASVGQTAPIELDGYSSYLPRFKGKPTYFTIDFTPVTTSGQVGLPFICGDINDDTAINIFDITFLIGYLYIGGPPPDYPESADVNNDGLVNIFDITYLIEFLYMEGSEPNCI